MNKEMQSPRQVTKSALWAWQLKLLFELGTTAICTFVGVLSVSSFVEWYIYVFLRGGHEIHWASSIPVSTLVGTAATWVHALRRHQNIRRDYQLCMLRELHYEIRDVIVIILSLELPPPAGYAKAVLQQAASHVNWVLDTIVPDIDPNYSTARLEQRLEAVRRFWKLHYPESEATRDENF